MQATPPVPGAEQTQTLGVGPAAEAMPGADVSGATRAEESTKRANRLAREGAEFLNYVRVEKGLAQNTVMSYRRDLSSFVKYLDNAGKDLPSVTRDDLRDFFASLYARELAARSVARHLVSIRGFFSFLLQAGKVHGDPAAQIDSPQIERSLPRYLTGVQVDALLQQPHPGTPAGLRDKAMLE